MLDVSMFNLNFMESSRLSRLIISGGVFILLYNLIPNTFDPNKLFSSLFNYGLNDLYFIHEPTNIS